MLIDYLMNPALFGNISPINRAQLLDDALNLARAELLSYDVAMNVTAYLSNEVEYLPWRSAFTAFSYMDNMLIKTGGYDKFKVRMTLYLGCLYHWGVRILRNLLALLMSSSGNCTIQL